MATLWFPEEVLCESSWRALPTLARLSMIGGSSHKVLLPALGIPGPVMARSEDPEGRASSALCPQCFFTLQTRINQAVQHSMLLYSYHGPSLSGPLDARQPPGPEAAGCACRPCGDALPICAASRCVGVGLRLDVSGRVWPFFCFKPCSVCQVLVMVPCRPAGQVTFARAQAKGGCRARWAGCERVLPFWAARQCGTATLPELRDVLRHGGTCGNAAAVRCGARVLVRCLCYRLRGALLSILRRCRRFGQWFISCRRRRQDTRTGSS